MAAGNVDLTTSKMAVVETSTTAYKLSLNPYREYSLAHLGLDASDNATTDTIFFAVDAAPAAQTYAGDTNKLALKNNMAVTIGPDIAELYFQADANDPSFQVIAGRAMQGAP